MSRVLGVEAGGGLEVDRHFGDFLFVGLFCDETLVGDERYAAVLSTALSA